MMRIRLDQIRDAMEGAIPGIMATCSPDGEPNVAFLSQVHYVDDRHVALSYQFFNKTRRNILANPFGQLTIASPLTAQIYRLDLRYLRTEVEGPLYERMKAHLEGIASHTGMTGVFHLRGSDIYEVQNLEVLPGDTLPVTMHRKNPLAALRRASESVGECTDFGALVDTTLDVLHREMGAPHAMFLVMDEQRQRLFTLGSRGYRSSGVGSEVRVGEGVIGQCAMARTPIRISWVTQAYRYSKAIRDHVLLEGSGEMLSTEIPYPGLNDPHSQMGIPLMRGGCVLGVLFVESSEDLAFTYDDEDALVALAGQVAVSLHGLREAADQATEADEAPGSGQAPAGHPPRSPMRVRYFRETHSVFFDEVYIIKGVAGAILWRMLREFHASGRTAFSNRELRLDPEIHLPDIVANLEARLILLRKRLEEQNMGVVLARSGRGRLSLTVDKQLRLEEPLAPP